MSGGNKASSDDDDRDMQMTLTTLMYSNISIMAELSKLYLVPLEWNASTTGWNRLPLMM